MASLRLSKNSTNMQYFVLVLSQWNLLDNALFFKSIVNGGPFIKKWKKKNICNQKQLLSIFCQKFSIRGTRKSFQVTLMTLVNHVWLPKHHRGLEAMEKKTKDRIKKLDR